MPRRRRTRLTSGKYNTPNHERWPYWKRVQTSPGTWQDMRAADEFDDPEGQRLYRRNLARRMRDSIIDNVNNPAAVAAMGVCGSYILKVATGQIIYNHLHGLLTCGPITFYYALQISLIYAGRPDLVHDVRRLIENPERAANEIIQGAVEGYVHVPVVEELITDDVVLEIMTENSLETMGSGNIMFNMQINQQCPAYREGSMASQQVEAGQANGAVGRSLTYGMSAGGNTYSRKKYQSHNRPPVRIDKETPHMTHTDEVSYTPSLVGAANRQQWHIIGADRTNFSFLWENFASTTGRTIGNSDNQNVNIPSPNIRTSDTHRNPFLLEEINVKNMFGNASTFPCHMFIYDIICKEDKAYRANTAQTTQQQLDALTASYASTALTTEFRDDFQRTNELVSTNPWDAFEMYKDADSWRRMGTKLNHFDDFWQKWTIVGKTHMYMEPGQQHTHTSTFKCNWLLDPAPVLENYGYVNYPQGAKLTYVKGKTHAVLVRTIGVLSHDNSGATAISAAALDHLVYFTYKMRAITEATFPLSTRRLAPTQNLPSGTVARADEEHHEQKPYDTNDEL